MGTPQWTRDSHKALLRGVMLNSPVDLIKVFGYFPILINTRTYQLGQIEPRFGFTRYNNTAIADLLVHTIRRLNNDLVTASQAFSLIVGAGTGVYSDDLTHTSLMLKEGGFSGNPLSLNPFRPDQSPEPWMFISDANKLRKMRVDGTIRNWGIAPPILPPTGPGGTQTPALNSFQFTFIDSGASAAGWAGDGTVVTNVINGTAATAPIGAILFDSGSTGWASIGITAVFNTLANQAGFVVDIGGLGTEKVVVDSVYKAVRDTTVQSIVYDSGTTGLCTVQPTSHKHKAWVKDALFQIGSEYVRVLSVTFGPDRIPSVRVSTTINHVAGEAITGVISFRAFCLNTHTVGTTLTWLVNDFIIASLAANSSRQIGTATKTVSLDLSSIGGRPLQDNDEMNFIVFLSDVGPGTILPQGQLTINEVQLQLDCSDGTFSKDYFYAAVRPSDFASTVAGTSTAAEAKQQKVSRGQIDEVPLQVDATDSTVRERLQRRIAKAQERGNTDRVARLQGRLAALPNDDDPSSPGGGSGGGGTGGSGSGPGSSVPLPLGVSVYAPVKIKVGDVTRAGTDFSKGWADITSIRIRVSVSNPNASAFAPEIIISSWWIGGAFGPTVSPTGTPYLYRYRWRSSLTGTRSNPSPATRSGVTPRNQRVQLVGSVSTDLQVDKMDWFRFGGEINEWLYIGTSANSSSQFNDDFPDDVVVNNPRMEFNLYQPFPILDTPKTGTCNVSGSTITRTGGDLFNTSWAPGTLIIANNIPCTVYSVPTSNLIHINESLGTANSVTFLIQSPILHGQPLPAVWGPYGEGVIAPRFFGCGSPNEPGVVRWTNGSNPPFSSGNVEASDVNNYLEVTNPSEPMMNGCLYDGRIFAFSTKRQFYGLPNPGGASEFVFQEVANSKGLFGRYGLCVSPKGIYFASDDGIYFSEGGQPRSITNDDLYPLFPHDGHVGTSINGYDPPDTNQPNSWQLSYADSFVFFNYIGVSETRRTLVYSEITQGWQSEDRYTPSILVHYADEGRGVHRLLMGGSDGRVYIGGGNADHTNAIACQIRYPSDDQNQPFTTKVYGDSIFDLDAQGASVLCVVGYDQHSTAPDSSSFTNSGRVRQRVEHNSGAGREKLNISSDISWSSAIARPIIYDWLPSYLLKVDETAQRRTDWEDAGIDGPKWFYGIRIKCDTANAIKQVKVQSDGGVNGLVVDEHTLNVRHNGESTIDYDFNAPFIAHNVRLQPIDTISWKQYSWQWLFDPDSPLVLSYISQVQSNDLPGWQHLKDMQIAHISTADITLTLVMEGTNYTYTIPHSNGIFRKTYIELRPIKFKTVQYRLVSTAGFRLYKRASETRCKAWKVGGPYVNLIPFGEIHAIEGPRI